MGHSHERSATVPYADPARQREATRIRVARSRERARAAATVTPEVTPDLAPILPAAAPLSGLELDRAGAAINCPRMLREVDARYHERLRGKWKAIRAVLEG
jgi:hypothetical protein